MNIQIPDLDESSVKEFMNRLPDITDNPRAVHLSMLAARSRKARQFMGIKVHDLVVERSEVYTEDPIEIATSVVRGVYNNSTKGVDAHDANTKEWKSRWFNRINNYHLLQHAGIHDYGRFDDKTMTYQLYKIPSVCMGIFACVSPRDIIKAFADFESKNIKYAIGQSPTDLVELGKHSSRFFGQLHKHKCDGYNFVTIDVDEPSMFPEARDMLTPFKKFGISHTSRGYHIVLDLCNKQAEKDFYGGKNTNLKIQDSPYYKLQEKFAGKFDFQNNAQEPVWGTLYYAEKDKLNWVTIIE
jgi:hypothetical protein